MTRAAAMLLVALLGGCAISPPPPAPDPIAQAALHEVGQVALPDAAQAAFCVAQAMPASLVELVQDGATVRPAAAIMHDPAYALVLTWAEADIVAWRLLVASGAADRAATALALRRALADCLGRLGRMT